MATTAPHGLREENRTLYRVIKLVSSPLELGPMLEGIVDLTTEATDCHACFIYLRAGDRLTMRAASPVYADVIDKVQMGVDEGLTGWVARHRTPEFIRENAMGDPRMKYVPLLEEERFQSMVAVPILSRAGDSIGVVVLHTEAPHEFTEDTLKLLVHIASLVSGAVENAQLYDEQRHRVNSLAGLSALAQHVADATEAREVASVVARGVRRLLDSRICQVYRMSQDEGLMLLASYPEAAPTAPAGSAIAVLLAALDGGTRPHLAQEVWPGLDVANLLVTPLSTGDERVGLLCVGAPQNRSFSAEDTEIARAAAHLAAIAIKRAELIGRLTNANIVKDLFEALEAGAAEFAATKATEVGCELTRPFLIAVAEPVGGRGHGSSEWRAAAESVGRALGQLTPCAAVEVGPGPVRGLLPAGAPGAQSSSRLVQACRELGRHYRAVIGVSDLHDGATAATLAYREAQDAVKVGTALMPEGGVIAYSETGAYRYLVHISADDAPHDRMRAAVDALADYDRRRRTVLLGTLESYLAERRSAIETARALFIHPNTLRQRLGRIEELTGLRLEEEDLLSLELAIKLARLHGRPAANA
ncbi:MAG TPA: GAF domain-containing protein [Solirubrobacteraceae bacterium]